MTHIERNALRRRSFIVGASATGLAFGYVATNGIKDALAAKPSARPRGTRSRRTARSR